MTEPTELKARNFHAFPCGDTKLKDGTVIMGNEGMTLLDYFAGIVLAHWPNTPPLLHIGELAESCYDQAYAMLKAREVKIRKEIQQNWTDADLSVLRSSQFLAGLASLPKDTRGKVIDALLATSYSYNDDFESTFSEGRLSIYKPNMENVND